MSRTIIIGAGKTGRGFLARLLCETRSEKEELVFVDKDPALVERLNAQGSYQVHFFGGARPPITIDRYQAYLWESEGLTDALRGCDTIFVSVGGQNLPEVGKHLREHLDGASCFLITAENASHPADTLRREIGGAANISEGTVFCTTIEAQGLDISSENYPYFQFDADALPGYVPPAEQFKPISGFSDFLTRKLYTYNAASCVIAYLGWLRGYTDYGEAANDPEIVSLLDRNYEITNRVLCREYGYDPEDQRQFAALSKAKFQDRTIKDSIARNARDPKRKLSAGERIIGPLMLMRRQGEDAGVLEETAAAALLYDVPSEEAWNRMRKEKGLEGMLREVCALSPGDGAYEAILRRAEALRVRIQK